jgi:plasmid stabilization system protein ParE
MGKPISVLWTRPALDSLLDIVRYIQFDNPPAAQRLAAQIKTKVSLLEHFPSFGRVVPEFPRSGLREILVGNYRIMYLSGREGGIASRGTGGAP